MGNACACNTDTIQITKVSINRNPQNKVINIDTNFCLTNQIGPFFGQTNIFLKLILRKLKYNRKELEIPIIYNIINYSILKSMLSEKFSKHNLNLINNNIFRPIFYIILLENIKINISDDLKLRENDTSRNAILRQIDCDIPRTFPHIDIMDNKIFTNCLRDNLIQLASADSELSYVQGINFIVAFLQIIYGNNSERTIEIFLKLMNMESKLFSLKFKHVLTPEFTLLHKYFEKFREALKQTSPKLFIKLYSYENNEYTWLSKWIQTIFIYNFRLDIAVRLFDIIIHNVDLILPVSLAIVHFCQKELIKANDLEGILSVFSKIYNLPNARVDNFINYIINYLKVHNNYF
jgi:hypothetical protein